MKPDFTSQLARCFPGKAQAHGQKHRSFRTFSRITCGLLAAAGSALAGEPPASPPPAAVYAGSRSPATKPESDIPEYVTPRFGSVVGAEKGGIDLGAEFRARYEHRSGAAATDFQNEDGQLGRNRIYIGMRELLDPFRFRFELLDARVYDGDIPENTGNTNEIEVQQLLVELYQDAIFGSDLPLSARFGRQTMDLVDRRLVNRTRFGNVAPEFDGFRLRLGTDQTPIEANAFAVMPAVRRLSQLDLMDDEAWLFGGTATFRTASPACNLSPYLLVLSENPRPERASDREFATYGLHTFGDIPGGRFDYDLDVAGQTGEVSGVDHQAWAGHAELGYRPETPWFSRAWISFNYATGDGDTTDGKSQAFDPLFGDRAEFYGYAQLFSWSNMINPGAHVDFKPAPGWLLRFNYRAYWLADDAGGISGVKVPNPGGGSGDFIGQALEAKVAWNPLPKITLEAAGSYLFEGDYLDAALPGSPNTTFFYLSAMASF
jgi:hypothetical protein